MSAEVLRRAASLMRERAEAATGGDWSDGGAWWEHWTDPEGRVCHTPWPTITTGSLGSEIVGKVTTEADATHIASWHPAVALAVADWLEAEAAAMEALAVFSQAASSMEHKVNIRGAAITVSQSEDGALSMRADTSTPALTVARAYLGEAS